MFIIRAMLAVVAVLSTLGAAHASQGMGDAQPLSIKDLHKLYSGKTWQWTDGGGYFAPGGGFSAHTGEGDKAAFVNGGWGAYADGRICFWGTWVTAAGKARKATCFRHASNGGVIYQQKPDGQWYVFKNAPAGNADMANMIVAGDLVSAKVAATRQTVTSKSGTSRSSKVAQKLNTAAPAPIRR